MTRRSYGQLNLRPLVDKALIVMRGYPGAAGNIAAIANFMGKSRDQSFVSHRINGHRAVTERFLHDLTRSLRLDQLGFGAETWVTFTPDQIATEIRKRRDLDPFEIVMPFVSSPAFFTWLNADPRVLGIRPDDSAIPTQIESRAVSPGTVLKIRVTLPFDGFFKLVCRENNEIFSLDESLDIRHKRFLANTPEVMARSLRIGNTEVKTTVFGLASTSMFGSEWPINFDQSRIIDPATCSALFKEFIRRPERERAVAVMTLWTVPPQSDRTLMASVSSEGL